MCDLLKPTQCGQVCQFDKISKFCYDCPSLMCENCFQSSHRNNHHNVLTFTNQQLQWSCRATIQSLLEDCFPKGMRDGLIERVCEEVSRNVPSVKVNETVSPEDPYSEQGDTWTCTSCTTINDDKDNRCEVCRHFRPENTENKEYDAKLSLARSSILFKLREVDTSPEVPLENVLLEVFRQHLTDNIRVWYNQTYAKEKNMAIVNEVLAKYGHQLPLNVLNQRHRELISEKNKEFCKNIPSLRDQNKSTLMEPSDVNDNITVPNSMMNKKVLETQIWDVLFNSPRYTPSQARMLMTEMNILTRDKIQLMQNFLLDEDLGAYVRSNRKESKTVELIHLQQAVNEQITISDALNFLKRCCSICCEDYPLPMIKQFLTCDHEFCTTCMTSQIDAAVTSKFPCKWFCPNCDESDFVNVDKTLHYATMRTLISERKDILKIFEEKLLQERLRESPYFHWCSNDECEYGFEAEGVQKIQCPICHTYMCVECNRKWHEKHEGISCQEFELWMLRNDPDLSKLLKNIGIECPNCNMRYAIAAGGCLHFDCKACGKMFCGACYQLFVKECDRPGCQMTGFHGHHPRNCLYYLRDEDAKFLENMLKDKDYPKLQGKPENTCQYMVTDKAMKDVKCGHPVVAGTAMCEVHYKEYLVQFINRFQIDPADFANSHSLNMMLFQGLLPKLEKQRNESENQFTDRLKKEVKGKCLFYIPNGADAK